MSYRIKDWFCSLLNQCCAYSFWKNFKLDTPLYNPSRLAWFYNFIGWDPRHENINVQGTKTCETGFWHNYCSSSCSQRSEKTIEKQTKAALDLSQNVEQKGGRSRDPTSLADRSTLGGQMLADAPGCPWSELAGTGGRRPSTPGRFPPHAHQFKQLCTSRSSSNSPRETSFW